jgi:hypothetical protein
LKDSGGMLREGAAHYNMVDEVQQLKTGLLKIIEA